MFNLSGKVNLWKAGYIFLGICLVFVSVYMIYGVMQSSSGTGWDYQVYMGAVNALNQGKDPYITENIKDYIGAEIPYSYPPHTLVVFKLISFFNNIWIYRAFCLLSVLIGSYFVLKINESKQYFFYGVLMVSGFITMYWNFLTGNSTIIYLFFIALILYLLKKERLVESAIIIGLMASITVSPIIFIGIFLFVKRTIIEKLKLMAISVGTFGGLLIASYIINPILTQSFLYQNIFTSSSPIFEPGGMSTPTSYSFFGDVLKLAGINNLIATGIISAVYVMLVIIAMFYFMKNNDTFKVYCMGFLSIFMLLPRVKPYQFIMILIPLYFLAKDYSYKMKLLVLTGISSFPLIIFLNYWSAPTLFPEIVNRYAQTLGLFFIFMFIIVYDQVKKKGEVK